MDDHYDAKKNQFTERRSQPKQVEIAVVQLKTELTEFRKAIESDLQDNKLMLQNTIELNATLQNQTNEALRQMQNHISDQLKQNDQQHREIISLFKEEIGKLVTHAEQRIDMLQKMQTMIDADQEKRIGCLENDMTGIKSRVVAIEVEPTKAKAGRWDRLAIAIGAAGIAIITSWGTSTVNNMTKPVSDTIQAVLPTGESTNAKAVPKNRTN